MVKFHCCAIGLILATVCATTGAGREIPCVAHSNQESQGQGSPNPSIEPIEIGNRREIFVDRFLVDSLTNARLELQHPQPAESVIKFDKPWEGPFCGYVTVIRDGDVYHMYYRGLTSAGGDGTDREVTCYATSPDGINWLKPELGIHEFDGRTDNNIVLRGQTPASHNFAPFLDKNPNVNPEHKFKALAGTKSSGLIAFVSADGLTWNRLQEAPVFRDGIFDSQNVSFWSEVEQQYVCYFRSWTGGGFSGFRSISRTTSDDFVHWSKPQAMTFGDVPDEHLYTNQTTPYFRAPHISLSLAARFMPGRKVISPADAQKIQVNAKYSNDCSDSVLLSTRGGNRFDRTFMESLIRPGLGSENWVSRSNYLARGIVPTSDSEVSVYLSRNYGQPSAYLQRFVFRTDGFASVSAGYAGGQLLTKPIKFFATDESDVIEQLSINMSTSAAGSIAVEIQDNAGKPIPGFALSDCDQIVGDQLARTVSWSGKTDVSQLAGKAIRLRFRLNDADLFSFRFQ